MTLGTNKATKIFELKSQIERDQGLVGSDASCIFLSHRRLNKDMVRKIGEYIKKAGIDIYLDENGFDLQSATTENNDKKITECIQKGISESSHILCLLSPETIKSWWVPYEIGYGDRSNKKITSLKLKELKEIPSYLKIRTCLEGITELNNYLSGFKLSEEPLMKYYRSSAEYQLSSERSILEKSTNHPLSNYLVLNGYKHQRINHSKEFAIGRNHINGIENFWSYCKMRLSKFHGLKSEDYYLHLKECEFRYNNRNEDLYKTMLQAIKAF